MFPRRCGAESALVACFYSWYGSQSDYQKVYDYFRQWCLDGTWERINGALREKLRITLGCEAEPSAAIVDGQIDKTPEKGGHEAMTQARTQTTSASRYGRIGVEADLQDRTVVHWLFLVVHLLFTRLELIAWVKRFCGWTLESVKRLDDMVGFHVLPRRWVVERTFGWLGSFMTFPYTWPILYCLTNSPRFQNDI